MLSSAFFTMGKTHNVCQDYALAGVIQSSNRRYAVLSDGCSSVAHTDVGARLAVLNAVQQFRDNLSNHSTIAYYSLYQAKAYLKSIVPILSTECLTATLLVAEELADGNVRATVYGDGFILARNRTGPIDIFQMDFQNYPFYPLYLLSNISAQAYFQYGPKIKSVTKTTLDPISMQIINKEVTTTEYTYEKYISEFGMQQGNVIALWSDIFSKDQYDLIMLASDGIDSFFTTDGVHVPPETVIPHLINIKTFAGEFMLRRGRAVTRDVCEAKGWIYHDDVSLAAIYLGG